MWLLKKILLFIAFAGFFLRKLVEANLFIAKDLLTPGLKVNPAYQTVPLMVEKDFQILLLANLISMTPGSLAVEIDKEKSEILIHSMYAGDEEKVKAEIDEFQVRIKKLFE